MGRYTLTGLTESTQNRLTDLEKIKMFSCGNLRKEYSYPKTALYILKYFMTVFEISVRGFIRVSLLTILVYVYIDNHFYVTLFLFLFIISNKVINNLLLIHFMLFKINYIYGKNIQVKSTGFFR
jgi:hypothetical protein